MFKSWNPRVETPAARASSKPGKRLDLPLAATAACIVVMLTAPIIGANPTGGKVVRGDANINTHQPGQVTIDQHSGKAVINWNGFSIEKGEVTQFDQPGRRSIALNRVVTNRPSRINGQLRANGNVWLINQNGVTVGRNGTVKAQGFLATTSDIADDNFMAGRYQFDRPSPNPHAKVINRGHISLGERGLGALVAPHARNDGVIEGQGSTVVIAGAKTFAVDLYGDDLIHFETKSPVTRRPAGVEALAANNGIIQVDGGRVLITAVAAEGIVDQAIQIGGKIHARSVSSDGGEIVLDGGNHGTVAVTGTLDASSSAGRGGKIDIRGRKLRLGRKSLVKASGGAGGGDIRIGGDRGGQGPGRNADRVILAPEARIIADATGFGDGGSIIVYGQRTARIAGKLTARGGQHGGDGGFIETSAAGTIDIAAAQVDASAPAGNPGTWLIDPQDIEIDITEAENIVAALEGGSNVEVTTADGTPPYGTGNPGPGNITVVASIRPDLTKNPNSTNQQNVTLTLTAHNDVIINNGVTIGPASADTGDSMGVTVDAGGSITNNGIIDVSAGAGGDVNLTAANDIGLGRIHAGAGDITIIATTGAITDNNSEVKANGSEEENLVGGNIGLTAGGAIGATGNADIDTAVATKLDAQATGGDIFIDETGDLAVGQIIAGTAADRKDITLTAGGAITDNNSEVKADGSEEENLVGSNISLTAGGAIGATGAGAIDTAVATKLDAQATGGNIYIDETGDLAVGQIIAGTDADRKDITLTAGGAINDYDTTVEGAGNENLVGGAISLTAGGAIGATGNADIDTAVATKLDAQATGGNIFIDETGDLAVGQIIAGTAADRKDITLTAGGAISDHDTTAEGAGNENLVGGAISLTAGGAIGASGAGAIDTAVATKLDAQATGGNIFIDETGDLAVGQIIAGTTGDRKDITLTAGGAISDYDTTVEGAGNENLVGGAISLTAGGAIGATGNADIDTAAATKLDAQATGGNIFIDETGDLAVGQIIAGTAGDRKDITLTAGGAISDHDTTAEGAGNENLVGGAISLTAGGAIGASGAGAIDTAVATKLDAQATGGNIYIDETASLALGRIEAGTAADRKDITLTAGGAITDNNSEVKADDSEEENLVGGAISLTAGGSIGAAGDGDIDTQVDSLDASADGDIFIDETDALDLGRIVAVTNPGGSNEQRHAITIEAGSAGVAGGLTDKTPDDDSEENLVGGAVRLTAVGGAIGAADATDIDTKVDSLDASAGGDIFIDETDDLALGQIVAGTDADRKNITLTAGGAITDGNSETKADDSEEENLVGGNISLTAGGAIGATGNADIDTAVATKLDAQATGGNIFIDETGDLAVGQIIAGTDADRKDITLTAGGAINDYDTTVEGAGNENLVGGAISLTAGGAIGATGNADIDTAVATKLDAQATGGNIFIDETGDLAVGQIIAGTDADRKDITLTAGGAINDYDTTVEGAGNENLVGGAISLTAGGAIGATGNADIDTEAVSLDAKITGATGGIFITETGDVTLGSSNTKSGTTESMTTGGGAIEVTSGGNMTVAQAVTTAGNGKIDLTTTAGNLQVDAEVRAGGDLVLDAAGLLETADGPALSVNDGGLLSAGGAVSLAARGGDIALGRVVAGTDADRKNITVTAGGAISDHDTAAEDANLVGGDINLTAGSGIGEPGGNADIDTTVTSIDAQTASGGIFIDETGGVTLGTVTTGNGGGAIEIISGGGMTVAQKVTTAGSGDIRLHTEAGDLLVDTNSEVTAGGDLDLDAAGRLNIAAAVSGSSVALTGGTGIEHTAAGDVTATSGTITATATTNNISMADGTRYSAGGDVTLIAANDVALGRVEAGIDNTIVVTATEGAISDNNSEVKANGSEEENLVGGNLTLTAGGAIGTAGDADIDTAAASISADTTDGGIDIDNTSASAVTVTSLTSTNSAGNASGDIRFDQSGGGAVTFSTVTTNNGAITLTNTDAGLSVSGPITASGTGKNLTLTTFGSGDITLTGTTTATDDEVHITSAGAIDGAGLVTAAIADLDAATGIGDTTALELATARISADTTDGGIDIDNTSASAVTVTSLTSTNSAGNASGDIRFDQSGGGAVTFSTVTTNDGAITLTNTNAGLSVSGPITAGGAGNAVNLDAAGLLHIAAAVSGSNVELTGGTGITHTAAGDVTSGGTITATAEANDISMADGTRYSAGGAVSLTAQNNIALGRVEAGAAISVTATTGAISDNTAAEGAGNENLVGGSLTLRAATGIGASGGAADIDTAAGSIDAQTTTGGIFIDETDAVTLGPVTTGNGGGPIEVTAGAMTVAQAVTTAGGGAISLTTTAGDLQVGQAVTAGGALSLDAAGQLILAAAVSGGDVELSGGAGVAHTGAGDVTSSGALVVASANDIDMADGTVYSAGGAASLTAQGGVALGRVEAGTSITVTAATGAISDNTAAEGAGNENLVARDVSLTAATGIGAPGAAADIDTAADTIDAGTGSGGIYLAETDAVQLGNQASVTTGDGGGAVEVTAGGALTVARAVTTAGGGAIRLTTRADDLQVEDQVTAGGASSLGAAARLILAAAVSGSEVELSGGTGIAHTADGDVTATSGAITAVAVAGDIDMADGTLYQAAGNAELRAQGSVALGRVDAGGNTVTVTATEGAISDNTAAEGAGNENLVAGDLSLTAATGIGAPGAAADIDTAVDTINAQTTRSGGIYLAETDAVTLASTTGISAAAGADIDIRSGGEMVVEAGDVQAFASGDIRLTATAGDLVIGGEVATDSGDLELTADGSIRQAEGRRLRTRSDNQGTLGRGLLRTRSDNQGTLALRSGLAIGTADAPILTDVAILAAEAAGGGVFATQVDGTQGNLVIGTTTGANPLTGIRAHNGDIEVTTQGFGSPPDYGRLDILGRVRVVGSGDIRLCAEAAQSDLVIRNIVSTDKGIVELEAGRRIISDFDLSGFLIRHDTVVDSSLQLTRSLFENLAEAYAVPDYSVNDELDLMYLSSPNEAIWGGNRRRDEDEAAASSEAE